MSSTESQPEASHSPIRDHTREEAALRRAVSSFTNQLDGLAECHESLAQLMQKRVSRPWTSYEHAGYIRLRRARGQMYQRLLRTQRTFERARLQELQLIEGDNGQI